VESPCKGKTNGRPCSALSERLKLMMAFPGRRCALPWAELLRTFGADAERIKPGRRKLQSPK
jgi:hypothetical protein